MEPKLNLAENYYKPCKIQNINHTMKITYLKIKENDYVRKLIFEIVNSTLVIGVIMDTLSHYQISCKSPTIL